MFVVKTPLPLDGGAGTHPKGRVQVGVCFKINWVNMQILNVLNGTLFEHALTVILLPIVLFRFEKDQLFAE